MLGKTAGGLFWMFRYLERSENTVRLLDAGFPAEVIDAPDAQAGNVANAQQALTGGRGFGAPGFHRGRSYPI